MPATSPGVAGSIPAVPENQGGNFQHAEGMMLELMVKARQRQREASGDQMDAVDRGEVARSIELGVLDALWAIAEAAATLAQVAIESKNAQDVLHQLLQAERSNNDAI